MSNTMGFFSYIKEHIFWNVILFGGLGKVLIRSLPGFTYWETVLVLLACFVCVTLFGILLAWKRGKNYLTVAEDVVITWGIFFAILYADILGKKIWITVVICIVLSLVMAMLILGRKIETTSSRQEIIKKRIRSTVFASRRIMACGLFVLIIPLVVMVFWKGTYLDANVKVTKTYGDEHGLSSNIEEISKFAPEKWEKLDVQEKLNVSQILVNCEARYWGLSHEVYVGVANLEKDVLGGYNESMHKIVLDMNYFKNADGYDVMSTLIHECAHAYQHAQIEVYQNLDESSRNLLMFDKAATYLEEFSNYQKGSDGFVHYYYQECEEDAREAEKDVEIYRKAIEDYLKNK